MKKKLIALLVVFLMTITLIPTIAFADDALEAAPADILTMTSQSDIQPPSGPQPPAEPQPPSELQPPSGPPSPSLNVTVVTKMGNQTLDIVGGEVAVEDVISFGIPCWKLTPSAKYGFQFDGFQGNVIWYGHNCYVIKVGSQTVTATFKLKDCVKALTIDIHGEGTVGTSPEGVKIGSKIYFEFGEDVELSNSPATGWEFDKWEGTTNGNKVKMCTDKKVDGYFKKCIYDITFCIGTNGQWSDGTTDSKIVKTEYGEAPAAPVYDANTGYYFVGWSPAIEGATGPATYTATWAPISYTVKYDKTSGDAGSTDDSAHTYDTAAALTKNGYSKTGYTFAGWADSREGTTAKYTDGQSVLNLTSVKDDVVTMYAIWKINTYAVKFADFDGKVLSTQAVNYGSPAAAPANPAREGYTFTGWDKDYSKITGDLTVTAQYKINTYTVKFVDFDGKVLSTQTVNYGSPAAAPANPAREGYTFTSWDKDYSKITSDLTVTAQYKINAYTVKFVDFDGKVISTQLVNWGTAAVAPANPARSGYTFTGWDKQYSKITSDLTVTAQYKQNVSSSDEDIPGTYDSGAQPFPWLWIAVALVLASAIVVIVVSQTKRHKKTGDTV